MVRSGVTSAFCFALAFVFACGGHVGEPAPAVGDGEGSDEIIGGAPTAARPEIGRLALSGSCTATLISPRVAITAAHCVGYASTETDARYGDLEIDLADGRTRGFSVSRYRSYSSSTGDD